MNEHLDFLRLGPYLVNRRSVALVSGRWTWEGLEVCDIHMTGGAEVALTGPEALEAWAALAPAGSPFPERPADLAPHEIPWQHFAPPRPRDWGGEVL